MYLQGRSCDDGIVGIPQIFFTHIVRKLRCRHAIGLAGVGNHPRYKLVVHIVDADPILPRLEDQIRNAHDLHVVNNDRVHVLGDEGLHSRARFFRLLLAEIDFGQLPSPVGSFNPDLVIRTRTGFRFQIGIQIPHLQRPVPGHL